MCVVYTRADVGASHVQLMCLVWHSFSQDTRGALLSQCAHSVVAVAQAIEYVRIPDIGQNWVTH